MVMHLQHGVGNDRLMDRREAKAGGRASPIRMGRVDSISPLSITTSSSQACQTFVLQSEASSLSIDRGVFAVTAVQPMNRRRLQIARLQFEFGIIAVAVGVALFAGLVGSLSSPSSIRGPIVIAVLISLGAVMTTNGFTALLALHLSARPDAAGSGPAPEQTWLVAPQQWRP